LLSESGIPSAAPLHELPVIDEAFLLEHYYSSEHERLTDAEVYLTSGSVSGCRKRVLYGPRDQAAYIHHRKTVVDDFVKAVPRGTVAVTDIGIGHAATSTEQIFRELGFDSRIIDHTAPARRHIELMNQ
jgi:hypothetical protein